MWIVFDGKTGKPGAVNCDHVECIAVNRKHDTPQLADALEALSKAVTGDMDMEDILSEMKPEFVPGVFQVVAHPTTSGMYVLFEGTEANCEAVHRWIMNKIDYRVDVINMADHGFGAGETKPMEEAAPEPDEAPF